VRAAAPADFFNRQFCLAYFAGAHFEKLPPNARHFAVNCKSGSAKLRE
jgi:hypothetical protein